MPTPQLLDHLLVFLLVAVVPLVAARRYRRLVRRVEAGAPGARLREYGRTILVQWAICLAVVTVWLSTGRPTGALGFVVPGGVRLAVGAGVTALGLAFLWSQWRAVRAMDEEERAKLADQMESVRHLMPRSADEAARFRVLSVTAGICEEIVYRGYLVWYLAAFVGPWPAAVVAGALFGVLHLYQGPAGILRTGVVGVVMALLYVGSGSLLWPVILHAAVDLNGGAVGRRVLEAKTGG